MGVGADLPRTPSASPAKVHWSLPEQPSWGGDSVEAQKYVGRTRKNYKGAREFKVQVDKELRSQGMLGQLIILPEAEARARFGARLTIAPLNALQKDVAEDGTITVRVLHDGTTGVDTNKYILVRDACLYPLAPDIKMVMRYQSSSGKRYWALLVDVSGAHRTVQVREEDWPLQACQLEPGGSSL